MAHILIADDDAAILAVIEEAFTGAGWQVTPAQDGALVLPLVEVHPPDVVLLDVAMPPVDGLDVLRALRAHGYTMPVIVFSAQTHPSHVGLMTRLVAAAGGQRFLAKPFDLQELLETASAVLAA